jgi:hypothetical protein
MKSIPHSHLGYYKVDDRIFRFQPHAFIEATNQQLKKFPKWLFNVREFYRHNWTIEPSESMDDLYKKRALHLRESYDHLVLSFSGGADSTNILKTFLSNNIRLDEIYVRHPKELVKNMYTPNTTDLTSTNIFSEYDLVIVPMLQYISRMYPNIKITVEDPTKLILEAINSIKNTSWILDRPMSLSPTGHHKLKGIRECYVKGKKTAHIYGLDKPMVCIKDGNYYAYFIDNRVTGIVTFTDSNYDNNIIPELFYWSPDAVPLMIKQCHIIKRFFQEHPTLKYIIESNSIDNYVKYVELINPLIYPSTWTNVFQVKKNISPILMYEQLYFPHLSEDVKTHFFGGIKDYIETLDPKLVNTENLPIALVSDYYKI